MDAKFVLVLVAVTQAVSVLQVAWSSPMIHDLTQDRAECTQQLLGIATCLPYVGGNSKAPTIECCSGLKKVLSQSLKCLCILVKDRDDPNLGLKINSTLALGLPSACHAPVNISKCIDLLELSPSSSDAQMFAGFEKSLEGGNSTHITSTGAGAMGISSSSPGATTADEKSHGTKNAQPWLFSLITVALGVVTWDFLLLSLSS